MFFKRNITLSLFTLFFYSLFCAKNCFAIANNDPSITFLMSIKDMSANYTQEQYDKNNISKTNGKIIVKKPDSVMLTHNSPQMKLKIISINGNVKIFDENIKQTTYIENQYSELMQFFTKNLKPEKIRKNKKGHLCLPFKSLGNNFEACLSINLTKKTISNIFVYIITTTEQTNNDAKDVKNTKNGKNGIKKETEKNNINLYMNIKFSNVKINHGINDDVFFIKDNRIFNDDEF